MWLLSVTSRTRALRHGHTARTDCPHSCGSGRVIPLYLDMTEDAQLLYDRDAFFAGILDRVRTSLKRLGSRRIRKGKTWYWDLKPDFKRGDVIEM